MNIENREIEAVVKFLSNKGFGFIEVEGRPDAFFHVSDLADQGFHPVDMVVGTSAVIDYDIGELGKPVVLKFHRVGNRMATPEFTRTVVDKNANGVIVKVVRIGSSRPDRYEVREGVVTGKLLWEGPNLAGGRTFIGKVINPPTSVDHGQKTNVPGRGPAKGPSNGQKLKKAA